MSDNSQELALRLMRVKETTIAAKHTAESSETKATKEKKQVLDLQGLLDDVYLLIVKHLTPADLIQLIGSSKHFKQYLDIDFYWTQFCLRALVNSKTGQAKEIFKHFSLLKKEIGLLFPNDMIAVFSSLPTTIPKKNLEDEYDSLLSIEDFSDTSVMVVNRPTERDSYIAMMIENRRLFSNRGAIITCGHLNVKPGDKDPSSSAIMFCHTQMGHLSTTLLVRAIDHRYLDLIRTLVERNKEYL